MINVCLLLFFISENPAGKNLRQKEQLQTNVERTDCLHRDVPPALPEDQDPAERERHGRNQSTTNCQVLILDIIGNKVGDTVIGTHYIDLSTISNDGDKGDNCK